VVCIESTSFWNFHFVAFSMAFQSSGIRLGSAVNDILLPYIYDSTGNLAMGFWIGFFLTLILLATSILFCMLDYYGLKDHPNYQPDFEQVSLSQIANFPMVFWIVALSTTFIYGSFLTLNGISSGYAQTRFGFSITEAGVLIVFFL